nr:hypothetical protein [Tanacetum cinerariifolium]
MAAAKAEEFANLSVQNVELLGKVSGLEFVCEELKCQDAKAQRITKLKAELDTRIVELNNDIDTKLYPHMMTVVARRQWMIRHGLCLAVIRSLTELEDYDSGVEAGYMSVVNELDNVSLSLLDQPKALKDYSLMSSLTLKGDHGEEDPTPEFRSHEIMLFNALVVSHSHAEKRKKDYQISSVTIVDGTIPATETHDDLFDTTLLDKPVDHQLSKLSSS